MVTGSRKYLILSGFSQISGGDRESALLAGTPGSAWGRVEFPA
jgi:hypothetical protein